MTKPQAPCGKCKNEMMPVELRASLRQSDPFRVSVEIPAYRCGCGKESVHGRAEAGQHAFKAIGHAYRSVDIHPQ